MLTEPLSETSCYRAWIVPEEAKDGRQVPEGGFSLTQFPPSGGVHGNAEPLRHFSLTQLEAEPPLAQVVADVLKALWICRIPWLFRGYGRMGKRQRGDEGPSYRRLLRQPGSGCLRSSSCGHHGGEGALAEDAELLEAW